MNKQFFNLYTHHFARVAVAIPRCRIADPSFNVEQTLTLARQAADAGAVLVAFPELGISAYSCEDLFHQRALLDGCLAGLQKIIEASNHLPVALVVGLPLKVNHQLFNCAAVVANGRVLGVVPKSFLPNYGEFYESRQFSAADCAAVDQIDLFGAVVPFGPALLFEIENLPLF
ncbi:NAD(+) synthase, partial [Halobellus sp. Atlit-31R]